LFLLLGGVARDGHREGTGGVGGDGEDGGVRRVFALPKVERAGSLSAYEHSINRDAAEARKYRLYYNNSGFVLVLSDVLATAAII
jgi:hypothetical protein